jgi:hypothetical protein
MGLKSGIYGVVRLEGGPADIADCEALGLAPAPGASAVAAGVDPVDPGAVHTAAGGDYASRSVISTSRRNWPPVSVCRPKRASRNWRWPRTIASRPRRLALCSANGPA